MVDSSLFGDLRPLIWHEILYFFLILNISLYLSLLHHLDLKLELLLFALHGVRYKHCFIFYQTIGRRWLLHLLRPMTNATLMVTPFHLATSRLCYLILEVCRSLLCCIHRLCWRREDGNIMFLANKIRLLLHSPAKL